MGLYSTRLITVCISILLVFISNVHCYKDCVMKTPCSCEFDDGSGTVDLTSLGNTDDTPRFKDVKSDSDGYFYSYNPCKGFSEDDCEEASACVLNDDKSESQQIGDYGRGAFKYDDDSGDVLAAYTSGRGVLKLTTVSLVCDPHACTPTLTSQGEQEPGQFALTMTSVCACPGMCSASGPGHCSSSGSAGGLSGGSIILIIFFTVVVIYFVAGIVVSKYARKKEGKEIVPNILFWQALPILIKIQTIQFRFLIIYLIKVTYALPVSYSSSSTWSTNPQDIMANPSKAVVIVKPMDHWFLHKLHETTEHSMTSKHSSSTPSSHPNYYPTSTSRPEGPMWTSTISPEMTTLTTSPTPPSIWSKYWTSKMSSSSSHSTSIPLSSSLKSSLHSSMASSVSVETSSSQFNSASSVSEDTHSTQSSSSLLDSSISSSEAIETSSSPINSASSVPVDTQSTQSSSSLRSSSYSSEQSSSVSRQISSSTEISMINSSQERGSSSSVNTSSLAEASSSSADADISSLSTGVASSESQSTSSSSSSTSYSLSSSGTGHAKKECHGDGTEQK